MTEKEIQKLSRAQALKILLEQTKRSERLSQENVRLRDRISERESQLKMVANLADEYRMVTVDAALALDAIDGRSMQNALAYLKKEYGLSVPSMQSIWYGRKEALFGDLGLKEIDKAAAVQTLVDYLHADMGDTIAFGDAKVDIPMLECCAYGVAMGSGGEEIKAAADYVTGDVDKDGLYQAFEKLGLLKA